MRYGILALALVVAVSAVPAAGAPAPRASTLQPGWDDTAPRWSPDGRAILFQSTWDAPKAGTRYALGVVQPGALARTPIGRPDQVVDEWDFDGEWSPDGSLVAFTRQTDVENLIYVSGLRGAGQRRLSPLTERDDHSPTWAPDGRRLAFLRGGRIATVDVDGTDARVITTGEDYNPRWSPDGRWIAFLRLGPRVGPDDAVFVVRPDGTGRRRVTGDGHYVLGDWSPDSSRILAVTGSYTGKDVVAVLRADGSRRVALGPGTAPDWSPTGDRVAFYRSDGLYIAPVGGGTVRRVYRFAERRRVGNRTLGPDWSPEGRRLAFAQRGACIAWGVYTLDLGSGRAERVSNDCHIVGTPGRDDLRGTNERDIVMALGADDFVDGNPGDRPNEYYHRFDDDLLDGGPGADVLWGRRGHDVLLGGPGNDRLRGGRGTDRLLGGPGDDFLDGGPYYDRLDGGTGDDAVAARDGFRDRIRCGRGYDRVSADRADDVAGDCELVTRAA